MSFLKISKKLEGDIKKIRITEEPDDEIKLRSKELMRDYYLKKGDTKTALLFT